MEMSVPALQVLYESAFKRGTKSARIDADCKGSGPHASAFRDDVEMAVLTIGDFTTTASRAQYQHFNLKADIRGMRFSLEIRKGEEIVFGAKRTGTGSITKLDVDETIIGTDTIEEGDWTPVKGAFPPELLSL